MYTIKTPIRYLKLIGSARLDDLKSQKIETLEDLLYQLPFRYEDRRSPIPINKLKPGETVSITGKLISKQLKRTKGRMTIIEAVIGGNEGYLKAVWFNQPYLSRQLKPDDTLWLYGKVDYGRYGAGFQMNSPSFEIVKSGDSVLLNSGKIVPVYRQIRNTSTKMLRRIIHNALFEQDAQIPEILPSALIRKQGLLARSDAFRRIHFPEQEDNLNTLNSRRSPMHTRLIYEEFLLMQASLYLVRQKRKTEAGVSIKITPEIRSDLLSLPSFSLSSSQKKVLQEILSDMSAPFPMNRLLQGDVGTGKTIVALLAAYAAVNSGYQAAIMVPTEVLADQHFKTASGLFGNAKIKLLLLTSAALKGKEYHLHEAISTGEADLVIGTHALIQEKVKFKNLGLVIIDEQHRFGVMQRAMLTRKGLKPDTLVMTATPIPRSLALTAFGGHDLSLIEKAPFTKKPVETVLTTERKREEVYNFIRKHLARGKQAYVVCPVIQGTEKNDLKNAIHTANLLKNEVFKEFTVELLHGRMSADEKKSVMQRFSSGEIQVLTTTTVIEVGIDVPNATVMLVEHSERFGLSQLHQLRGRVGRSAQKSYCILMISPQGRGIEGELDLTEEAKERLKIMRDSTDGFEISRKDLEIRGPGEFLGTRQAGIPHFRIADLSLDYDILMNAYADANWFFSLPDIERSPDYKDFICTLREWWKKNIKKYRITADTNNRGNER